MATRSTFNRDRAPFVWPRPMIPALVALVLLALDVAFWFTAHFATFEPPGAGTFDERLHFAAVTGLGPIGLLVHRFAAAWQGIALLVIVLGLLVVVADRIARRSRRPRLVTLAILGLWFLVGFTHTSLRIR